MISSGVATDWMCLGVFHSNFYLWHYCVLFLSLHLWRKVSVNQNKEVWPQDFNRTYTALVLIYDLDLSVLAKRACPLCLSDQSHQSDPQQQRPHLLHWESQCGLNPHETGFFFLPQIELNSLLCSVICWNLINSCSGGCITCTFIFCAARASTMRDDSIASFLIGFVLWAVQAL